MGNKKHVSDIYEYKEDYVRKVLSAIRKEVEGIERYGSVDGHDIYLRTPEEIKSDVYKILDKYKRIMGRR